MAVIRTQTREASAGIGEILLVEDQRALAQMAAKMLHERWGCRVLIATNLAQVRAILAQGNHQFFLVVSDLNLPDAPHGEVIDVLIDAKLRVIAMTGMYDEAMHDHIMSKGVVDYVLKDSINAYEYIVELVGRLHRNMRTKVLVVDDSDAFCDLVSGMLRVQGLQVVVARDGLEGLECLERHRDIKLALVDHEMPNMDGFNFLLHVRRKLGKDSLAVIGVAGSGNLKLSAQFLKLGANDFISKPCSYDELVCRVSQNLEMQESLEAVRHVANHDFLTGLLNRRAFFEQGGRLFEEYIRAGAGLGVAVMDIDFFKKINDSHGHDGGDIVLKHFAHLLEEYFQHELVARVGGEEFFVLFKDAQHAAAQCEGFRALVESSQVYFGDTLITHTISIGLSCRVQSGLDDMLKAADENLYQAKQRGRNRVVMT